MAGKPVCTEHAPPPSFNESQLLRLRERVGRLKGYASLPNFPPYVLAMEVTLVTRAMYALFPEAMGQAESTMRQRDVRREHGACIFCGGHISLDFQEDMCRQCFEKAREDGPDA
jgi:hypothetical protein